MVYIVLIFKGDRLTLSSKKDFDEAFKTTEMEGKKSLKIFVIKGVINDENKINNDNDSNNNDINNENYNNMDCNKMYVILISKPLFRR